MSKNTSVQSLKIGQASKQLGVSIDTLRRWEASGKIQAQRTEGGTRVYSPFVKIGEAAKILGVSIDTLRRWEKAGKIAPVRTPGSTRLYSLEEINHLGGVQDHLRGENILTSETPSTAELLEKQTLPQPDKENYQHFSHPVVLETLIQQKIEERFDNLAEPSPEPKKIYAKIYAVPVLALILLLLGATFYVWRADFRSPTSDIRPQTSDVLAASSIAEIGKFLEINADTVITGNMAVNGESVFGEGIIGKSTLSIDGATTLSTTSVNSSFSVTGLSTLTGGLTTPGKITLTGNAAETLLIKPASDPSSATKLFVIKNAADSEKLSIDSSGATILSSTLKVSGATTLSSTISVSGATTLSSSLEVSGTSTLSGAVIGSAAGAASTPGLKLTGAWYTGGSTTTSKPQFLVEPTDTTSTGWSASGTGIGVNAKSTFTGNLIDLQVAGTSKFKVDYSGNYTSTGVFLAADGTVSAPAYSFSTDTDTGIYRSGTNTLDFSSGGVRTLTLATATSGVNYISITPAATGSGPTIVAAGSDTNIPLTINSILTGALTLDSTSTGTVNLGTGNNAKTINVGTGTAGNTINIGTNNTTADTIAIGSALDSVAITDADWSITTAGLITTASDVAVNGGDITTTTTGTATLFNTNATTLSIGGAATTLNIGNASGTTTLSGNFSQSGATTFGTGTGAVSLNGDTTIAAGKNLALTSGTGTFTQTYSNTTGTAATHAITDSASSGTTTVKGIAVNITGTANATGTNTITGIDFANVVAATNNTYYGLNFGTGFNDILRYNGTQVINGSGQVVSTQITGTLFSATGDTGTAEAIVQGNTLTIAGGTNGIDTVVGATDTVTINLDTTEIGTTTFGTGSSIVWTFNSGTTDPVLTFGDNTLTIGTAATITATDVTALNCTDCIDFDDMVDTMTIDAATTVAYTGAGTSLALTNSGAKVAASTNMSLANTSTSSTASINKYALQLSSTGVWNGTSAYAIGLEIQPVTGGTNNAGLCFDCDGTYSASTVASGIQFGTDANAVSLYRSANDVLRTGDGLTVDLDLIVSGGDITGTGDESIDIGEATANGITFLIDATGEVILTSAAFSPSTSDGNALGTTALMWADLFLASGGVINLNNGDVTLTHGTNLLTFGGGDLDMGNNLVVNIGAAGTDFTTNGGLTLAELLTVNDDVDLVFDAGENLNINASSTANTTTAGVIDLNVSSATDSNRGLDIAYTHTATGATTSYSAYNAWASTAVVAGAAVSQTGYGIYNTAAKTGADTATGTYSLYGMYSTASNTGRTDAGIVNTYGGYFDATGDTAGTASVFGVYIADVSGGDTNVGLCFDCDGTYSASTVASGIQFGTDANAVTLYRSASDILRTGDGLTVDLDLIVSGGDITGTGDESIDIGETTANGITLLIDATGEVLLTSSALSPSTSDGNALGTTALMWADLFLASGGVINFNNGGETVTHSATGLTFATSTLPRAIDIAQSGAKTVADYGLYLANTSTSSTASINKYGAYITSTGTWNGTSAVNYGLYVDTPTGGTTNYAAAFAGGNVGIGTTTPGALLQVGTNNTTISFGTKTAEFQNGIIVGDNNAGGLQFRNAAGTGTISGLGLDASDYLYLGYNNSILYLRVGSATELVLNTTSFSPATSDGTALGTTALMWSDLFLASGGVINFNNGDVTLTHAADTLTFDGGNTIFNEAGGDFDFRIEGDTATTLFVTDAGLDAVQFTPSGTRASAAGATWDGFSIPASTATITGSTNITTATGFNLVNIGQPTLSAASALTVTNSATLYIANAPTGGGVGPAAITNPYALWVDDGNVRFDGTANTVGTITSGTWNGTDISLADGGTNASLTASNGGIFYSTATAGAILAGTATANQILLSGASTTPAWSTATYPATTTVSQLLYSSSTNVIAGLTTANSGVLVTGGTGIPAIATDIPTAVTIGTAYIYRAGGTDVAVADGGTNCSVASITCFNNITGYTAAGATGTTSTNLVFSTSPALTTPTVVTSIVGGTSFDAFNTVSTTLNIGGAATTALNIGNGSGTITNIGNAGGATAFNVTTGTGSQTLTSNVATGTTTTSGFVLDATAITSGTGLYLVSDSVTTGRILDIATSGNTWTGNGTTNGLINLASSSTAGTASSSDIMLNIARSGANAQLAHTAYGIYSAVTNTNVTSGTNVAGYFSASGATTNNYALYTNAGSDYFATTQTVASGASATLDAFNIPASTITVSGSTNITTATGFNLVNIGQPTYSNASIAVSNAATLYIAAAPTASGGGSITNPYALWVDAGDVRLDGTVIYQGTSTFIHTTGGTSNFFAGVGAGNTTLTGTFNTAVGASAGASITSGSTNTLFGRYAGNAITSGGSNNAFGYNAGVGITTGSSNILFGNSAGQNLTTGLQNTFVGSNVVGSGIVTGTDNTITGYASGSLLTSGNYNTYVGSEVGRTATTASNRTMMGYFAGYSSTGADNTFIGYTAGRTSSTGTNNTFVGSVAGFANTTGSNNITLGYAAGDAITTGSNNLIIGYDIDAPSATASNQMSIGNFIFATGIAGTGTTISAASLGIGVTAPTSLFQIGGLATTKAAPTTTGAWLGIPAATLTDNSTAASGTAATGTFTAFGIPTYAASNTSVTVTDAANVYIAGAPAAGTNVTLTNPYALWVDAGESRFDGIITADATSLTGIRFGTGSPYPNLSLNSNNLEVGTRTSSTAIKFYINGGYQVDLDVSSLSPADSDAHALGTTSLMWSDLFLASGGVINFNNGDVTLTHGTDALTVGGGSLTVTGSEGSNQLVLTAGDTAISDGSLSITDDDNAVSLQLTNNTITTGNLANITSTSLTTGSALKVEVDGLTTGNALEVEQDNRDMLALTDRDLTVGGHTDLITQSNITNTFVYDTSKDMDGGKWTDDDRARSSSWYNETIDNTSSACVLDTNDRCGQRAFPKKALMVVTTTKLYIYDAKDNTLWMDFRKGSGSTEQMIGPTTNSTGSVVFALNGKVYYGNNGSSGSLYSIDFKTDSAKRHNSAFTSFAHTTISNRNSTITWKVITQDRIGADGVTDIHGNYINGKTYIVVLSAAHHTDIISEDDNRIFNRAPIGNANVAIWLDKNGDLWSLTSDGKLAVMRNIIRDSRGDAAFDRWAETGTTYNGTLAAGPALWSTATTATASTPNALYLTDGTSTVDGKSPTVYIAHDLGLTVLNTKRENEYDGSAKYYTNTYITEEMAGDIRTMIPMTETASLTTSGTDIADRSYQLNRLMTKAITTNSITSATGAVRGTGLTLDGTDDYLCADTDNDVSNVCDDNADFDFTATQNFTIGIWFKHNTISTTEDYLVTKGDGTVQGYKVWMDTSGHMCFGVDDDSTWTPDDQACTSGGYDYDDNNWHHLTAVKSGQAFIRLYIDGQEVASDTSLAATGTLANAGALNVGADSTPGASTVWAGSVDEFFITAEALTTNQIKKMASVGQAALQNHNSSDDRDDDGTTSDADTLQNIFGSTNVVSSVAVDQGNSYIYLGTRESSDGANDGGVSVIGVNSDSRFKTYSINGAQADDDGTTFANDDIVSISLTGAMTPDSTCTTSNCSTRQLGGTLVIGTDGDFWAETKDTSFQDFIANSFNPFGETLHQTNLSVSGVFEAKSASKLDLANQSALLGNTIRLNPNARGTPVLDWTTRGKLNNNLIDITQDNRTILSLNDKDLTIGGHTDRTPLTGIVAAFVYDTTKDPDGGKWTDDDRARASSWYNETATTGETRGYTRAFPKRAIIVLSDNTGADAFYIFDAKDNSMWMKIVNGGRFLQNTGIRRALYAYNGKIYVSSAYNATTDGGIMVADFINDRLLAWGGTNMCVGQLCEVTNNGFSGRGDAANSALHPILRDSVTNLSSDQTPRNSVHAQIVNGKSYIVAGADSSVVLIDETNQVARLYSDVSGDDYNAAWLDKEGNLWALNETQAQLELWKKVVNDSASEENGTPDKVWDQASTPALTNTAPTIQANSPQNLFVTDGTSTVDGKSQTVYVGTDQGVTVVNTNRANEADSSVKYITKDWISEEMPGDVRGMWHLTDNAASATVDDVTLKANDLTLYNDSSGTPLTTANTSTVTTTSGIRGRGYDLNGSTNFLYRTDDDFNFTTENFTISMWVNPDSFTTNSRTLLTFGNNSTTGYDLELTRVSDTAATVTFKTYQAGPASQSTTSTASNIDTNSSGGWYHIAVVRSGTSARIFVNGHDDTATAGTHTDPATATGSNLVIGAKQSGASQWYDGQIDDIMITAEALNPSQIQTIYNSGHLAGGTGNHAGIDADTDGDGVSDAGTIQQLSGASNTIRSIAVDGSNSYLIAATNDGSDGGAVSVIGVNSDTREAVYSTDSAESNKNDDNGVDTLTDDDWLSVSIGGNFKPPLQLMGTALTYTFTEESGGDSQGERLGGTLVIANTAEFFIQTQDTSFQDFMANNYNPFGESLFQSNLNVNYSFAVGTQWLPANATSGIRSTEMVQNSIFRVDNMGDVILGANNNQANGAGANKSVRLTFSALDNSATPLLETASLWYDSVNNDIRTNAASGITTTQQTYDIAEDFPTRDASIEAGDVVAVDKEASSSAYLAKSNSPYQNDLIGIVSTNPGFRLSQEDGVLENPVKVALAGRVPVKVSTENGPIEKGDYLTSSSTPGVAMKATKPGPVIGKALESYNNEGVGKILAFVNVSFADPSQALANLLLDEAGNLVIPKIKTASLKIGPISQIGQEQENALDVASKLKVIDEAIATQSAYLVKAKDEIASASAELAKAKSEIDLLRLTPPDILLATGSATLANLKATEILSSEKLLTALDVTVSGVFKALGESFMGNTTIAGNLVVDGTFSVAENSINAIGLSQGQTLSTQGLTLTSGILYLQNNNLAQGLDILNGKFIFDKEGKLVVVGTVEAEQFSITSSKSAGTAKILAGQTETIIENIFVTEDSIILITPDTPLTQTLAVTNKSNKTNLTNAKFTVKLNHSETEDITFSYLIIGQGQKVSGL